MNGGFLTLWSHRRIVVRMHWTAPLSAFLFGRMRYAPGFWLGFLVVILVHELGHALVVRACGARVRYVDLHGAGGDCTWDGEVTPTKRALIAWGGVLAQLFLFGVVLAWLDVATPALGEFAAEFVGACTWSSLWLAAFNLIPARTLDGVEAWKIVPLAWGAWKRRRADGRKRKRTDARLLAAAEVARLQALDEAVSPNDEAAEDVVKLLERATGKRRG